MKRMITQKREYFNNLAGEWEAHEFNETKIKHALSMVPIIPGDFVLDVGCGTGVLVSFLKGLVNPDGVIIEIDFAQAMLGKAKQKYNFSNIHFIAADGETLPVLSKRLNHIICFASFPHFENKENTLQGFFRVLSPSGTLSIIHLMGSKELNLFHHKIGGPIENDFLPHDDELRKLMTNAGFHAISIRDEPELFFANAVK